jgi:hypothetical protein
VFEITDAKKTEVWDYMLSLPKSIRPRGMSDLKFERLKAILWDDADFWQAALRNGINLITAEELRAHDPSLYEDFIGNFFQVLYQIAVDSKPTKPQISTNADATHIPDGWYLSLTHVADRYGVKNRTVQQWVEKGWLQTIEIPGLGRLVNTHDLERFVPPRPGRRSFASDETR